MNPFIAVLLMALVTYIPRVLPIAVFNKEIKSNFIKSFLHYIPYSVLSILTFPDIFSSTSNYLSAVLGTIVALVLAFFERSLVIVAIGSVLTVFIVEYIINLI